MTPATPPQPFDPESLRLLTTEQLINIILEQQRLLEQLSQEVAQLKVSLQMEESNLLQTTFHRLTQETRTSQTAAREYWLRTQAATRRATGS